MIRRASFPAWIASLLSAVLASVMPAPSFAQSVTADGCVIGPQQVLDGIYASADKGPSPLGIGVWQDQVYVLPFTYDGVYDSEDAGALNVGARQWVTRSFLAHNPDRFDFVLVFTNFSWDAGEARGLYWSIANDVEGIGVDIFDLSQEFGSDVLEGYIDGMLLDDYRLGDGTLDQQRVKEIINHELGHRWLVHPQVDDGSGPTDALLGRDGSHWSYLYGVDDFMYGAQWTDNGDGTFTATSVRRRFSPLSLYLMGMVPPSAVPPFSLLENPEIDVTQLPELGATIEATARTLTVDDVIRAEGARFPDDVGSRHEFRVGMVFLVDPDEPYSTADLSLLAELRDFWQGSFFRETRGRGVVQVVEQGEPPSGGTSVDLPMALEWLARQADGGLWADSATTELRDSAEAVDALGRAGGYFDAVEDAVRSLDDRSAGASGLRYRKLEALARYGDDPSVIEEPADEAEAEQHDDGGWSAYGRYAADPVTTARATRALAAAGRAVAAEAGRQWLADRRRPDGSWSWQEGGPGSVPVTLEALLAFRAVDEDGFWDLPEVADGVDWLLERRVDGGFGDLYPNPVQTALFLQLVRGQEVDQGLVQGAIDFLAAHQDADGSWESSSYKTAVAVQGLVAYLLPDPYVDSAEVFVDPVDPFDGEDARLVAAVRNGGVFLGAGTEYEWQIYRLDGSLATVIPGTLPSLGEIGFTTVDDLLPGGELEPGDYTARLVIDPLRKISQKTRDNDTAEVAFEVRTHPAGIDLALSGSDLVLLPEEITATPMAVTVQGMARNQGLTDADSVQLVVFDGAPADDRRLGTITVDVASLGQTPFSVDVTLTEARVHLLTVVADPDRLLEDADRFNNRASRQMLLRLEPDLEIRAGGLVATPPTVAVGEPLRLDAEVWNGGTTVLGNFQVAFSYEFEGSTYLIRQLTVDGPLAPGASVVVGVDWTPNVGGTIPVTVEADPQDVIGDLDPSDNAQTLSLGIGDSPLANLRVTPASFAVTPDPPLEGQAAQIDVTIDNPSANAAGPFSAELWLDAIDTGVLLANQAYPGLAAGGSATLSSPWPVDAPDDRLLYVLVDRADDVTELDEADNQAFVEPDVQTLPNLVVTGGGVDVTPSFPQVGDAVHLDVRVANQGDQPSPASLLEWIGPGGTVLDSVAVPALDGHTEVTLGLDWDPGAQAGDYDTTIRVNADGAFAEGDYSDNRASVSVAIQDGELFVSSQIFSPNGDGVRDTTRISFRNGAESVRIFGPRGDLTRELIVEDGAESVVWDGRNDRGNLARDGLYQVRVGELETWTVVDNNLFAVTSELEQLLLTGFISPRVPGFGDEYSYFTSVVRSPVLEELYLVERYHAAGTSPDDDEIVLQKWTGDELIPIGDYGADLPLLSANLRGDTFLAGYLDGGPFAVVRYPDETVDYLSPPDEYGFDPWLSPDGRWVVWASYAMDRLFIEDLENPGSPQEFDAGPFSFNNPCGYSIDWTHNQRANVIVGVRWGESYFYDISFADGTPVVEVKGTSNYGGCGGGAPSVTAGASPSMGTAISMGTSTADGRPAPGKSSVGGSRYQSPDTSTDFDAGTFTWVSSPGYDYGEIGARGGDESFRVVWGDGAAGSPTAGAPAADGLRGTVPSGLADRADGLQKGGYGGGELNVLVIDLDNGELLEQGTLATDLPWWAPPPPTSISNDGFVVAFRDEYGGYGLRTDSPEIRSAQGFRGFGRAAGLLVDDPAIPERFVGDGGNGDEKGIGGGGDTPQQLIDWRLGEERELPFRMGEAIWSPADKYLVADLDTAYDLDGLLAYFTPAANLTVRLRPRVLFGDAGVDLWVLATDRYMQSYRLEYADLNAPDLVYEPIGLPSNELLYGESWGTWLPPANGTYRVRLTARDRAGNERAVWRRVVWNGDRDIANLYTENRYMSPLTSPGVKDQLVFHYTVLRPANLDFTITDENGNVLRELPVAADQVGPKTTVWDGDDDSGNPVPDGRYLLTYGAATWPIVVDNTPPAVTLRFEDAQLVVEAPSGSRAPSKDLWVNEVFAAVRDAHLEEWQYQSYGTHTDGSWSTEYLDTEPLERDGEMAWKVLGAHQLVGSERRIVARDAAGNETIVTRGDLDERLRFTDSEPGCRTATRPCAYPERPELGEIADGGGFLEGAEQILSPFYDTLLVHSSVQSDLSDLRLEYREISLLGLPSGPWQSGDVEVSHDTVFRSFGTLDVSLVVDNKPVTVADTLSAVYWNHPDLPMVPHEVRLRATGDGQEVISEPVTFLPEVPLLIEYLGLDEDGDRFRVTNASAGVVRSIALATREVDPLGAVYWEQRFSVIDRLLPGDFVEVSTGCVFVPFGNRLIRAQGQGDLGQEAVSFSTGILPREGYSALSGRYFPASCGADGSSALGTGFFGAEDASPCDFPPPSWPSFWVTTGAESGIRGRVPTDPTGAQVQRYELLVNGAPRLTVEGPFSSWDYQRSLDLSSLGEGSHTLTERYTYVDQPGLLGTCPQSFNVRIDRTPAVVQITEPSSESIICPADLTVDVALDVDELGSANHKIFLGNRLVDADEGCAPYTNRTSFEIERDSLSPGAFDLSARLLDQAGNASCSSIPVIIPDLPDIQAVVEPEIFSPTNGLGRPTVEEIRFVTRTPGTYELRVTDTAGNDLKIYPEDFTDGVEELAFAWDGTDLGGLAVDDGIYRAVIRAVSPCGAEQTVSESFELDKTSPEVALTAPEPGVLVGSSLEFFGSVTDRNFERYELQVLWLDGAGDWQPVDVSIKEVPGPGQSLGTWDTGSNPPGEYLVRVYAVDEPGNEAWTDEVPVTLRPRNFIRRFQREPELFSPNLDGNLDQVEIEYELIQDALVTLTVVDVDGNVVATLVDGELQAGSVSVGDGITVEWDGTSNVGAAIPDADYELVILAEDPLVPPTLESEEERLTAVVDTVAPELDFVSPAAGTLSGLPLQLVGSQAEIHPDSWTLELQSFESDRQPIAAGTGVFESRLLSELRNRPDGEYLAILSAVDLAANPAQTTVAFTVDNTAPAVQIFRPDGGAVLNTAEDYLRLEGEVVEDHLESYAWSYAPGTAPDEADFTVVAEGTVLPPDGLTTYEWDASGLPDGPYTLRLSATDEPGRTAEARRTFVVDNTPPEVAITMPLDGAVVSDDVAVLGSVDDANLLSWTLTPSSPSASVLPPIGAGAAPVDGTLADWTALPVDGDYELLLEAEDRAGNRAETSVMVIVSLTPPSPPVLLSAQPVGRDVTLVWQPGPGPAPVAYQVYRDGEALGSPTAETTLVDENLADGSYVYTVTAWIAAGIESEPSNALTATINLNLPLAHISVPSDGDRVSDLVQIFGTAHRSSGLAVWRLWVRPVGGAWVPVNSGTASVLADELGQWDTALPQFPDGFYELKLDVDDVFGNRATAQIGVEVDNEAPVAPVLTFAAADILDGDGVTDDIRVEWQLDPEPADLAGYYLYRNGLLANAPGPVVGSQEPFLIDGTAYEDRDLPDGTYVYFVTAADTAENESAPSNESAPITIDTRRPHAIIVDPPDGSEFEESTLLTAETPDLDVETVQFEYQADGDPGWTPLGPPLDRRPYVMDFAPGAPGLYHLRAVASDALGPDPAPESISLTEVDLAPPSPSDLTVRVDGGDIHLVWTAVPDTHGDLAGYRVYRDGDLVTPTDLPADQLTFDDLDLVDDYYSYRVTAVDAADNESAASPWRSGVVVTPEFDFVNPISTSSSRALYGYVEEYFDTVELQRQTAPDTWLTVASFTPAFEDFPFPTVTLEQGFNLLRFRGSDDDGNRSRWSRELTLVSHPRPAPPANVTAEVVGADVTVDWTESGEPVSFGYTVHRESTPLMDPPVPYVFDGAGGHALNGSGGTVDDWLRVVDGDVGTAWVPDPETAASGVVFEWTWPDARWISQMSLRFGSGARRFSVDVLVDGHWLWWYYRSYTFSTSFNIYPELPIEGVRVSTAPGYCPGCTLAEVSLVGEDFLAPPQTDPGVASGAHEYEVAEVNRFGQISDPSTAVALVSTDPPAPPTGLLAAAGTCGDVELSWQAPVPLPGVFLGYRLYRGVDGTVFEPVAEPGPAELAWIDTGLGLDTTFHYRLTTRGQVSGLEVESAPSNVAVATTECPTPPAPELLEPTVAGVPVNWPTPLADVGGRAFPGSFVTLFRDGVEVRATQLPAAESTATTTLADFDYGAISFDAAGRRVAYESFGSDEGVTVIDRQTGETWTFTGDEPRGAALDPAGERVAFIDWADGLNLFLGRLADGSVEQITTDGQYYDNPVFSADGRSLFLTGEDPFSGEDQARHLDLATGAQTVLHSTYSSITHLAPSPDGRYLVVGFYYMGPVLIDLETGDEHYLGNYDNMRMSSTPFSPDGRRLVFSQPGGYVPDARLKVVDLETLGEQDVSVDDGEFGAVFLDARTLALLRVHPLDDGLFSLVSRSLVDGEEKLLAVDLDRTALPWGEGGPWDLARDADGGLWLSQDDRLQRRVQPSGAFLFPDVELAVGTNTFVARQEVAGDVQDSLPIEVTVDPDAFGDAEARSITAVPGLPVAGTTVAVEGVARNAGQAPLEGLVASLVRAAPSGASDVVVSETLDLAPGETRRLRFLWDTTDQVGDYRWRLVLDPADLLVELDETNNVDETVVPVRETLGAHAAVGTDRPSYFLGDVAVITSEVTVNDAPAPTLVTISIEDPSGALVAEVAEWQDDAFGYRTRTEVSGWPVTDVYPGEYRAVVVVERSGVEAVRASAPFTVLPRIEAEVTGSSDRPTYARGDGANLLARVINTGDATLRDAVLRLSVTAVSNVGAGRGTEVASVERPVTALPVGDLLQSPWALDTSPIMPGNYAYTARVRSAEGVELAASEPVTFVITAAGAELQGALTVTPVSAEPDEGPLTLDATVSNVGDADLDDVVVKVDVIDPETSVVITHLEAPAASFAAGETRPFAWDLPIEDLPIEATALQAYLISLTAERPALGAGTVEEPLATASFLLVDRTPPAVELLEPTTEIVCDESMPVRVRAIDELSSVFRVFFHLDDGNHDLPLPRESVESEIFSSRVVIDPERLDPYRVEVFAEDTVGNVSDGLAVDFSPTIDDEPPVLTLDGPAEGACVASAAFTWTVDDLQVESVVATLDGVTYAAGEPVVGDGEHLFELLAVDGCSLSAAAERTFVLDATAPMITVDGVSDGGVYESAVTATWSIDDERLTASSATLDGAPVSSPLTVDQPGAHVLVLSGEDCAGNTTSVTVSFEITVQGGLDLGGLLYAPEQVFVGTPIEVLGQVSNQGTEDLADVELTLLLVDADDMVIDSFVTVADVPVSEDPTVQHNFDSVELEEGVYQVVLRAAGDFNGTPFDLELARTDVEVRAGLEIPTLGPGLLLLLSVLLAAAGTRVLRRRPGAVAENAMTIRPRGGRAVAFLLGAWALAAMTSAPPIHAQSPSTGDRPPVRNQGLDACAGHFPLLAQAADSGVEAVPLKGAATEQALEEELAVERALWAEEIDHQRRLLASAGGEAAERVDAAEARALDGLEALSGAMREKASLSAAELARLLACGVDASEPTEKSASSTSSATSSAGATPISSRTAPARQAEPAPRRPSENRDRPEGYLDRPSEALVEATAAARNRRQKREAERAAEDSVPTKVEIIRPDYLADKVIELAGDPVAIYNFVLQDVRPSHYFGGIKGPEAVLRSGEGNDADQAGLLAELLRLAGFPARLAWGVQEVPVGALLNHFSAPNETALERVLTAAGIPWQPVVSGGRPVAYLLDRVWAEVYLPYANYRGVVLDDSGATWLALDPQLKTFDAGADDGPRVLDAMGFDVDAFVDGYLAGDPCDRPLEQAGACPLPSTLIAEQVDAYLGAGEYQAVTAPPSLAQQRGEVLPPGMVGVVRGVDGFGLDLAESLQHRVRLRARDGSRVLLDTTVPASDLSGREATLWYVPATAADQAVVDAYGRLWNTPPYLVSVRLELRADGKPLVPASAAIGMGRAFELELTLTAPSGSGTSFVNDHRAGVVAGLGVGVGAESYAPPNGAPQNTLEVLAALASDYLAAVNDFGERAARLEGLTRVFTGPSVVTVGSVAEPVGSLGLIESLDYKTAFVDADVHGDRAVGAASDRPAEARRLTLSRLEASARERELFESLGMATMSADLALALAADRGITVHEIDASNLGAILPTLPFDDAVLDDVEGWVLAGGEALVPAEAMTFVDWTGVGYVLIDPLTGDRRYQIAGRLSGGMLAVPWFEVVEGVRTPLSRPHSGPVNRNGDEAVGGRIFDGNLQLTTVGETLSEGDDKIPFKVEVFDVRGVPVEGAEVTFTVLGGGGNPASGSVLSDSTGLATVDFTLGTQTDVSPYYLLFPEEDHATRAGLNVVAVEVNGHAVPDLFYAIGAPGEVAEIQQPRGPTLQGLPHLSLGTPVLAVPADQYGNPISNQEVVFTLSAGPAGEGKGPELISREDKLSCRPGTVIAGECAAGTSVTDDGAVNGVWAWLVLGEDDSYTVTASATGEDGGSASATFTGEVRKDWVPGEAVVGFPVLRVSGRGQPSGAEGNGSIEAYPPGETSIPLQVNVHVVREDFGVEECGDSYCRVPLGTYRATRLGDQPAPECLPESCGGGTLDERVEIAFNGAGGGATVGSPDADGLYSYAVPMPDAPGRYEITATPTAWVAIPLIPEDAGSVAEVEPCTEDPLCGGKFEIIEVSDENWRSRYVLWTVTGEVVSPTPVVLLGHDGNHEEDTVFQYQIQPPDYPALNTYMFFLEDGTVPFLAQTDGVGDGTATLPQGEMFDHPEGSHEVMMALNVGWVWSPRAGEEVPLTVYSEPVPFSIALLDVDADSNNDDDIDEPQRDDLEEQIEAGDGDQGYGKFVYVNHDNDDGDGTAAGDQIPDYADTEVAGEDNLVPMMVELRPEGGDWSAATLTFEYDGPEAADLPDNTGTLLGSKGVHDYYDYTQKKQGLLRLWRIETAESTKDPSLYVEPGTAYNATDLGFAAGSEVIKLWVEALNGTRAGEETVHADVTVKLGFQGSEAEKSLRFTPVEANIAVNNSSGGPYSYVRPGVPDGLGWTIDEYDEMMEDQGDGYRFWYSETGGTEAVNMGNIDDLSPLHLRIPAPLIEEEFDFTLQLVDSSREVDIELYRVPLHMVGEGLLYLSSEDAAESLIGGFFGGGVLGYSDRIPVDYVLRSHERLDLSPEDAEGGYLFRVDPFSDEDTVHEVQMNLLSREKGESDWHTVDSIRMTLESLNHFFSLWSARGSPTERFYNYKTECHPETACDADEAPQTVPFLHYPAPHHVEGTGMPDTEKTQYFMPVHGFNVDLDGAKNSFRVVTKRMFWLGFRGNVVAFTWEGDENAPISYVKNVDNAFRSSQSFRELIEEKIVGEWGGEAENIYVMAHSLGNQVVYDALRQHAVDSSGILFRNLYSVEPAIWQEVFWPQQPYTYGPLGGSGGENGIPNLVGVPITYDEDDLRCDSWVFWFNQENHSTSESATKLVHSYAWSDYALGLMRIDDYAKRNPTGHYTRREGSADCRRVPVAGQGPPALSDDMPVMMSLRIKPYGVIDLFIPSGSVENVMSPHNVDATGLGWDFYGHSDFQTSGFPVIYDWYYDVPGQTPKERE